jgi:hypothetical protein
LLTCDVFEARGGTSPSYSVDIKSIDVFINLCSTQSIDISIFHQSPFPSVGCRSNDPNSHPHLSFSVSYLVTSKVSIAKPRLCDRERRPAPAVPLLRLAPAAYTGSEVTLLHRPTLTRPSLMPPPPPPPLRSTPSLPPQPSADEHPRSYLHSQATRLAPNLKP